MDVFDIEDVHRVPTAVAARPRECTMCRECIRTGDWSEYVELRRVANHFIFKVETVGALAPEVIVAEVNCFQHVMKSVVINCFCDTAGY
jgi:DNA-directed RNA polymerase I and III subunit RPAC1